MPKVVWDINSAFSILREFEPVIKNYLTEFSIFRYEVGQAVPDEMNGITPQFLFRVSLVALNKIFHPVE